MLTLTATSQRLAGAGVPPLKNGVVGIIIFLLGNCSSAQKGDREVKDNSYFHNYLLKLIETISSAAARIFRVV